MYDVTYNPCSYVITDYLRRAKMSVGEAAAILVSRIIPEEMLEGVDGQQEAA